MHLKASFFVLFLLGICACQLDTKPANADFMLGLWQLNGQDHFEEWTKTENTYLGKNYRLSKGSKNILETIELKTNSEGTYMFVPVVANQNNDQPVEFLLSEYDDGKLVFTNMKHDFPNRIEYKLISEDKMLASVSGDKISTVMNFEMTKVQTTKDQ